MGTVFEHVTARRYAGGAFTRPIPRDGVSVSESRHVAMVADAAHVRAHNEEIRIGICAGMAERVNGYAGAGYWR